MIHILLSPLTWLLLLAVALLGSWRRLPRAWRIVGIVLAIFALLLCSPLGANVLVRLVESHIASTTLCRAAEPAPIALLSGGLERPPVSTTDYAALTPTSWRRLRGAVDAWQRGDRTQILLIAGGGPYAVKESLVQAQLARDLGVPASMLRTETESTTTWESAFALRGVLPQRIRVASSSLHLPRAMHAFRAAGFEPCALALDSDYIAPDSLESVIPQASAIVKAERAIYELAGDLEYALRASGLLPGGLPLEQ